MCTLYYDSVLIVLLLDKLYNQIISYYCMSEHCGHFPTHSVAYRDVFLNKEQLKLLPDGSLPNFKPSTHVNTQSFTFPPFTYAFLVIAKANASICV